MIEFRVGDLVLLGTMNQMLKGVIGKLRKELIGPFRIIEKIGIQNYKLELSKGWKIYRVFYIYY